MPYSTWPIALAVAIAAHLIAPAVQAEDRVASPEKTAEAHARLAKAPGFAERDRLTGDWGGTRTWLEERGIEVGVFLTTIFQQNVHGGLQTHNGHRISGSADYEITLDLETMGILPGATIVMSAESTWNDEIGADRVGSLLPVNYDGGGDRSIVVVEAWFEQKFWDDKARLKIGRVDIGADMDTNKYANDETSQFLNLALRNTCNIPSPGIAIVAELVLEPWDQMYVALGVADAESDVRETGLNTAFHDSDYFLSGVEMGLKPEWTTSRGILPGNYRLGVWYDPQPKEMHLDRPGRLQREVRLKRDDIGLYLSLDQLLYDESPDDDGDEQGFGMFGRYGYAHEDANTIEHFWSVGCQYQGLIPERDDDVLGFGFAQSIISDKLRHSTGMSRETVWELYYNAQVSPWLSITSDFQYIMDPGADRDARDAFVAGIRVQMSF